MLPNVNGYGPTCLSMVIAYLKHDNTVTPYSIVQYSLDNNYYLNDTYTKCDLMNNPPFNVTSKELSLDENIMIKELKSNHPIICSMKKEDFTNSGHFIVISDYINGKFKVNDPNSLKRSHMLWSYEKLKSQINNLWSYQV